MVKTRSMDHAEADIHHFYLSRSNRRKGLTQFELSHKTSTTGLFRYLNLSDDWMLRVALKHEEDKGSHSVVKEARKFARKIDLDLETEFDSEIKNTEMLRSWKSCQGKRKEGYQYCLEVKPFTWPMPPSQLKSWCRFTWHPSVPEKWLKALLLPHKIRASSLEIFRLIFFRIGLTLSVDSVIQALRLLTTSSQGALFSQRYIKYT